MLLRVQSKHVTQPPSAAPGETCDTTCFFNGTGDKSNFSWGNLGGTLGTTFLKDFLRGELPGTGWGNRGNPGGTLGSAFLKDFLRDVGGTLWGTGARAAAGGTGGTLGSTFLKDFLRDVGGTLWGTGARAPAGGTGAGTTNCRNSLSLAPAEP